MSRHTAKTFMSSWVVAVALLVPSLALGQAPPPAGAPTAPRPVRKGTKVQFLIDSTPQQATIYLDDKAYGSEGYTPKTLKLVKGQYKVILELQGYKPVERIIAVDRPSGMVFEMDRIIRPATLDIRSADQSAVGGAITVDGNSVGTVPNRVEVQPGSHVVEIKRAGFNDYRDTLQVAEAETRTMVVVLSPQVRPGSILVSADVQGAEVFVDGQRKDVAPVLVDGLPEGGHTVEVRKEGLQPFRQVVTVLAGQQAKVMAQLTPVAPAVGSLKVLSSTPGAVVILDGDSKGPTGLEIRDVRPGSHIVEVRAEGFDAKRSEIQIEPGQMRVVQVDLAAQVAVRQAGGLRVISEVPDADVYIDGALVGKAPIDKSDLATGRHFVVVQREGYAPFKTQVDVEGGKTYQVAAVLRASGSIRAIANIVGADVYLDGTPVGKTPATIDDVAVGNHVVQFKAKDYLDGQREVPVVGGQQIVVQVNLVAAPTGPTVAELQTAQREQSSWGATTLDRFKFNVDAGAGYPYFFDARLIAGLAKVGRFGFDLGIDLRTNGYDTTVGVRPRMQFIRIDPIAVGLDFFIGGGGGPSARNSFTFEIGPVITLLAGQYVRISFRPYYSYTSDRLCPSVDDIKDDDKKTGTPKTAGTQDMIPGSGELYKDENQLCKNYDTTRVDTRAGSPYPLDPTRINSNFQVSAENFGQLDPRERFNTHRFLLQGVIEVLITNNINIWGIIEGAPGQDDRQAFTTKFNSIFPKSDFPLYGRLGLSFKF